VREKYSIVWRACRTRILGVLKWMARSDCMKPGNAKGVTHISEILDNPDNTKPGPRNKTGKLSRPNCTPSTMACRNQVQVDLINAMFALTRLDANLVMTKLNSRLDFGRNGSVNGVLIDHSPLSATLFTI
jgi:hypothetical protein